MRKLIITVLLLIFLDISLLYYLNDVTLGLKTYLFVYDNQAILYQKKEIKLNSIDDFNLDEYFTCLSFDSKQFKYEFDQQNELINIIIDANNKLSFHYELIKPEVITTTKYITETVYIDNNVYEDSITDNTIYYSNDYYEFEIGTDLSTIIESIQDDIVCYDNVTCDYSSLNPYEQGEYIVYFYNDFDKISKIIKII